MSVWELEGLAEQAVRMVHASALPLERKRLLYASIFDVVSAFDIGFVHFRTTQELVDGQFFFRIDVPDHPEYDARQEELDAMVAAGRSNWLDDGLYNPDGEAGIWFDVSMSLWPKAVEAGLLSGLAAAPVQALGPVETLVELMGLAATDVEANGQVMKLLHGFMAWPLAAERKVGDPRLAAVLAMPQVATALNETHESWVEERFDARKFLEWAGDDDEIAFIEWWCTPYAS